MRLEFIYTPDDLTEANRATSAATTPPFRLWRSPYMWLAVLGIILLVVLNVLLALHPDRVNQPEPPSEGFLADVVVPWAPWVLIFLFIWFFTFRQLRKAGSRQWDDNPVVQQQQVVDVGDDGLQISSPLSTTNWPWPALSGALETPNLILLRLPNGMFLCIPKRAAAGHAELEKLRGILAAHVPTRTGAFPVLPVADPARAGDERGPGSAL